MSSLQGKKIILGITGSIAAYKAAMLVRLWAKAGAEVQVLMTESATHFISPLTLATLSKRPVLTSIHNEESWNNHVELGLWADAMVIAPLTATTLAKLSAGIADNIITAVYLSARCQVFFAPAMDLDMWRHPAVQENVQRLQSFGNRLIPVGVGELASGLVGEGRMAEPEEILRLLEEYFSPQADLAGKTILMTAGPTYEPIDPVRFIGNRSSGQMGIALADAAARRGAKVRLILGPSKLAPAHPGVETIRVETALQMYDEAVRCFPDADAAIMAAAVADYRPAQVAEEKIKKAGEDMTLHLVKNPDIAGALGKMKKPGQALIGFALETENEEANAREKMQRKNFDCIVLNSLRDPGAGFDLGTNRVTLLFPDNNALFFELKSKHEVADDILNAAVEIFKKITS
jgi:phosphopantothenoylcysteine decarboxylase / phosphopantothenate---cysteine ligase